MQYILTQQEYDHLKGQQTRTHHSIISMQKCTLSIDGVHEQGVRIAFSDGAVVQLSKENIDFINKIIQEK